MLFDIEYSMEYGRNRLEDLQHHLELAKDNFSKIFLYTIPNIEFLEKEIKNQKNKLKNYEIQRVNMLKILKFLGI